MSITDHRGVKAVAPLLALLILSGCSVSTTATPTSAPTPTTPPNAAACHSFAALTMTIPDKINNSTEPGDKMWESLRVEFDTVALTATGTVKHRMLDLSEHWPDLFDVTVMQKFDGINGKIMAVDRACTADGVTASFGTLTNK